MIASGKPVQSDFCFFGGRDYVRAVRLRLVLRPALQSFHRQLQSLGKELIRCCAVCRNRQRFASPSIAQQDLGAQTNLRQNPEKLQARWSQTYSAQRPLSENVPQPVEHRCPV